MTSTDTCPLCGGPNACAVLACGMVDAPCWCRSVAFSADLLAQVPEEARGLACVCARCAATLSAASVDQPEEG
ncbi:MAG: hypothetical protein EOP36_06060 [Rubrivivax sp.]|nr:MAG: hypothetical protein EOP36_06060 [Rubrivivax sp.]